MALCGSASVQDVPRGVAAPAAAARRRVVVQKFGGTSLGSADRLLRVAQIVQYAQGAATLPAAHRAWLTPYNLQLCTPGPTLGKRWPTATRFTSCYQLSARRPSRPALPPGTPQTQRLFT